MTRSPDRLFALRGGEGDRLLVLLHGMGANAEVWRPMLARADHHWRGRWIAPDLRGHGRSVKSGPFDPRTVAADVARLIADEKADDVVVVGHSFGGVIAAILGANDLGVPVTRVRAFGVKLDWSDEDVSRMHALAARPAQDFASYEEAAARALAFAGLKGLAETDSPVARAGVERQNERFRVAFDTQVFGGTGKDVAVLMQDCRALRLASGEKDAMAPLAPMRALDPNAVMLPGLGHNAHWEDPEAVWRFVLQT